MRLTRDERVADLQALYGAVWVASAAEMLRRMTLKQRVWLDRLCSEQAFLLGRGKPSPRLHPALADHDLEPCVACALANRRLMRRVLSWT